MCLQLYLAASESLPLVAWDERAPGVSVSGLHPRSLDVKARFDLPHVYYVGSYQGCGCGFIKKYSDELDQVLDDYTTLAAYVRAARERDVELQIYACWGGEEFAACESRQIIEQAVLLNEDFEFEEKALYNVR